MINLDDTSNCPVAPACFGCGTDDGLAVATLQTMVGVVCLTTCPDCAHGRINLGLFAAVEKSLEHCVHLGIDADEMAAAMEVEQ